VRKGVRVVLALAVLAASLFGCGGMQFCPTCGVDNPLDERMQIYNREAAGGGM
jgi:hypothetical protein